MRIKNRKLYHSQELGEYFKSYREEESLISIPQVEKLTFNYHKASHQLRHTWKGIILISGFAALAALLLLLTQSVLHLMGEKLKTPDEITKNEANLYSPANFSQYVWLKKSSFASLGIQRIQADEVVLYERTSPSEIKKVAISTEGEIYTVNNQEINLTDLPEGLRIPSFCPVFVTTGSGRKCLFQHHTVRSFNFQTPLDDAQVQTVREGLAHSILLPGLHLDSFDESNTTKYVGGKRIHKNIININIGKDLPTFSTLNHTPNQMMIGYQPQVRLIVDSMVIYLEGNGPKPSLAALPASISITADTVTTSSWFVELERMLKDEMVSEAKITKELTNLIPVVVPHDAVYTGVLSTQDYIFWYMPSKTLLKALDYERDTPVSNSIARNGAILKTLAYPNPTKGKLIVHAEVGQPRTLSIIIRNLLGQEVTKLEGINARGSIDSDLDLSKFAEGIYLLDITTDRGEQSMQRIIVEH